MTFLDHALALAADGFRVFPLRPGEKVPAITDWTTLASTDELAIHTWWLATPEANIGILTSDLLVIDVDVKGEKNGEQSLADLRLFGDDLPATRVHRTATGGRHVFLRAPVPVANGVDVLGVGLDIRGKNGYVVGPGSRVPAGEYLVVDALPVADAPEWVAGRVKRPRGRPAGAGKKPLKGVDPEAAERRAIALLTAEPGYTKGAGCDAKTLQLAMRVKDCGVTEERCWELMLDHWNERTSPPWPADKLHVKVCNAYRYGTEPVGATAPEVEFAGVAEIGTPAAAEQAHPVIEMNKEFGFILHTSGHNILWETTDAYGKDTLRWLPEATFHKYLRAQRLDVGDKKYFISELWMDSPTRRTYRGLCFMPERDPAPGYYNLWRGYAYPAYEGDMAAAPDEWRAALADWQDHALMNVCAGDFGLYDWLMQWFGHMVQRPWEKNMVAAVLRGPKGTGKNALFERVAALFGSHSMVAANRRYLLSNFNAHLEKTLFLVLDEAFWAGDKAGEGILKDLITGSEHQIEKKGQDSYSARNLTRVGIIGNENWLVPASEDERRFAVFDVGTGRQRQNRWFAQMRERMEAGGYSLLLRYLLDIDLTGFDLAQAPSTKALTDQKIASLPTMQKWWYSCLMDGQLYQSGIGGWPLKVAKETAHESMKMWARSIGTHQKLPDTDEMSNFFKSMGFSSKQMSIAGERVMAFGFADLPEARAIWAKRLGAVIDWDEC